MKRKLAFGLLLLILAGCRREAATPTATVLPPAYPGLSPTSAARPPAYPGQSPTAVAQPAATPTAGATATAPMIGATATTLPPTTQPAATQPPATATPAPAADPAIHYFRAAPAADPADPGQEISLEWSVTNALTTTLWHLDQTGQLAGFWDVAPTGSRVFTVAPEARNYKTFALYASNRPGYYATASVTVILNCLDVWFFANPPAICPQNAALASAAAEQPFEHGAMIWVAHEGLIYVLYNSGSPAWSAFTDEWDEGEPEVDPTLAPPAGLYQPARGFGLVWREQPGVRDRLGWATAPEAGFSTSVQRTSYPRYNEIYLRALDGQLWRLKAESSGWEKLPS